MEPIAETANGRVRGAAHRGALAFRGLRYGAPTGGANRFLPPRPVDGWRGVADALSPGASAPQLPSPANTDPFFSWYSAIEPISEDCLFLNVFTPGLQGKRPVLFWLHGGGWSDFSGTAPGFDGSILAREGDVIVVTINHRLNVFGFLQFEGGDERFADAGNAGALDIVAALEWVRDNVERFGGDPANVTLFGESGGASKVAALMTTERARGLFHKAVVQSSAGVRLATPEESARTSHALARALGQTRLDPAALQDLPMTALLELMRRAPGSYRGVIDGRLFREEPFRLAAPAAAADIPLLIGCTRAEFTYYMRGDPGNFRLELPTLRRRLARFLDSGQAAADEVIEAYRGGRPALDATGLLVEIATDQIFKRSSFLIARRQAEEARAPVYAYLFDWNTPVEGGRMRSPHTGEVPFVFGTMDAAAACVGTGPDLGRLSATMMATWASFARSGDPNTPAVPHWHPYDGDRQRLMILGTEPRAERDPDAAMRAALDHLPFFGSRHPIAALVRDEE